MKVKLRLDSHVSFNFKKLKDKACVQVLEEKFTHRNPVYSRNERMGIPNDKLDKKTGQYVVVEPEKYYSFFKKGSRIYFSRGCYAQIRKTLKRFGHTPKKIDKRISFPEIDYNSNVELRKEQEPAVEACRKKTQGVMRGPCSSGKSVIGLEFIAQTKETGLVVVWEKIHQIQWIKEALRNDLLNIDPKDIGGAGGIFAKKADWDKAIPEMPYPGNKKVGKLNIVMLQSMRNEKTRQPYFDVCGTLVADEVQRYGANTFNDTINFSPAKYRVGLSANEKRKDGKEFLIYDAFGKVIHTIADDNIGSRKKARINLIATKFESDTYAFTASNPELLNEMARDKARNKIIINRTLEKTSKKKLVLILVERKYQALYLNDELMKRGLKVEMLVGKFTKADIEDADDWKKNWKEFASSYNDDESFFNIKKLGRLKELDVVIATQKGNAGLSIKTFDHVAITTPTGGNLELFNQQKGRVERDYDEELKKLFGKKATPTVDYLWDVKIEKLRKKGETVLKSFTNVHVLQKKKRNNKGKKNGKKKSKS